MNSGFRLKNIFSFYPEGKKISAKLKKDLISQTSERPKIQIFNNDYRKRFKFNVNDFETKKLLLNVILGQ